MGMYDTLNGEQVKCFPWYSFYVSSIDSEGVVSGHGGDLRYYRTGDKIPYRSLAYNYGKDFIIFDFMVDMISDEIGNWVAHIVKDGRLYASIYANEALHDKKVEFERLLKESPKNIGYYGGGNFKFQSANDVQQYALESNKLQREIIDLYKPADAIMKEWSKEMHSPNRPKKDSEGYAAFKEKMDDYAKRHDEETAKIEPVITKLRDDFADRWIKNEPDEYIKMSNFGEAIEAGILTLKFKKEQEKEPKEKIEQAKQHGFFSDREKEWQLYCKYFKKVYGKMLEKEGEVFWEKYFKWCEITDEEKQQVAELRKALRI